MTSLGLFVFCELPLQRCIEAVVEKRSLFYHLMVVLRDERKSVGDGTQSCGFWCEGNLLGEIRPADDAGHLAKHDVSGTILLHQRCEQALALCVLVWVSRPWGVKSLSALALLDFGDLVRFNKKEDRLWINEATDQPHCGYTIDPDRFARHPFHGILLFARFARVEVESERDALVLWYRDEHVEDRLAVSNRGNH